LWCFCDVVSCCFMVFWCILCILQLQQRLWPSKNLPMPKAQAEPMQARSLADRKKSAKYMSKHVKIIPYPVEYPTMPLIIMVPHMP
jgi:hypothetical protein